MGDKKYFYYENILIGELIINEPNKKHVIISNKKLTIGMRNLIVRFLHEHNYTYEFCYYS